MQFFKFHTFLADMIKSEDCRIFRVNMERVQNSDIVDFISPIYWSLRSCFHYGIIKQENPSISMLGKIFSRPHFEICFLIFPRKKKNKNKNKKKKKTLTFHAKCILYTGFARQRHRSCTRSQMIFYFHIHSNHPKYTILLISTIELSDLYNLTNPGIKGGKKP